MRRETPPVPHADELAIEPTHESLAERGAGLRGEFTAFRESVAALGSTVVDTLDGATAYTPEQYDALRERINAETQAFEARIAEIDAARSGLLAEWETTAVATLSMHENISVPDASIVLESEPPLARLDRELRERSQAIAGVGVFTRLFSSAHRREVDQLAAHQRIMERIRSARAEVQSSEEIVAAQHSEIASAAGAVHERLRVHLIDTVDANLRTIVDRERPLRLIAEDPALLDRIDAAIDAEAIAPLLEEVRGEEPTPERDALIAEWGIALRDLLIHAKNDPVPDAEIERSPDAPQWRRAWNYGARVRDLSEAIRRSYPRDPHIDWKTRFPSDEERGQAVERADDRIDSRVHGDPRSQTSNLVLLFSEWRAQQAFDETVEPYRRDATASIIDHAEERVLRGEARRWMSDPHELVDRLHGIRRWHQLVEDSAFAAQSTPAERAAFAEFLIETLVRDALRPGGHESWIGTEAAQRLRALGDPRALPLMLDHIRYSGTGHTNVVVYGVLERMARTPDGQAHIAALPAVERRLFGEILNPDSILNTETGNDVYAKAGWLSRGEVFLAKAVLAPFFSKEREGFASAPRWMFLNGLLRREEVVATLRPQRAAVEQMVLAVDDCAPWWSVPGLAEFLAEDPAFLRTVAEQTPRFSSKHRDRFSQLLEHKKVQSSAQTRSAITEGMLALRSAGDTGAALLGAVLDRYRGSKDDPGRVRKLFRYFELLHRFGALATDYDSSQRIVAIDAELATLREQIEEPKRRRDRLRHQQRAIAHSRDALAAPVEDGFSVDEQIVVLDAELAAFVASLAAVSAQLDPLEARLAALQEERGHHKQGGLQGLVEHEQHRVTDVLAERLGVDAVTAERIASDINTHIDSGLIDIATTLLLSYEGKRVERPTQALREVITHVAAGDFLTWRYAHAFAGAQLAHLSPDARAAWRTHPEPVAVDTATEAASDAARPAAQRLLRDAVQHFREFEDAHTRAIAEGGEPPPDLEGGEPSRAPETLADRLDAIARALTGTPIDVATLRNTVDVARAAAMALGHVQVAADLEQVLRPFSTEVTGVVRAEEFDDPIRLLTIGTEPTETCQSWKRGQYNECLLAYVADANVQGLNVRDERGQIILRCIERSVPTRAGYQERTDDAVRSTIFLEPSYALVEHPSVYRALARLVLPKALRMGAIVQLSSAGSHPWPEVALQIFTEETESMGMSSAIGEREAQIVPSLNEVMYSDSFGGKLTPRGDFVGTATVMEFASAA